MCSSEHRSGIWKFRQRHQKPNEGASQAYKTLGKQPRPGNSATAIDPAKHESSATIELPRQRIPFASLNSISVYTRCLYPAGMRETTFDSAEMGDCVSVKMRRPALPSDLCSEANRAMARYFLDF
jgi:hypothetical protein